MFTGNIVAIVTSADEKGNICRASLKELIGYHVASSTSVIASVGTIGEFVTLDHDKHADVTTVTLELVDERIPVVAEAGVNVAAKVTSLTQCFNDSGIIGYLTVTPYYNCPSQEDLYQCFGAVAEHTDLPQILYNVPPCTGCDLLPETMGRLAKVKNIIGIKETIGNLTCVNQIKELALDDFALLSGDDTSALGFMQLGGHGVISVTANAATHDMAQVCKLIAEGHFTEARVINQRLILLHNKLFVEPNPISMKQACKELGLVMTDTLYLPMIPITDNGRETARAVLKHAGSL